MMPFVSHDWLATSRVGSTASCRSTSANARPAKSPLRQIKQIAAVGIVLGLPQQVAGHQRRIGRIVGDDHDLGRPGQQVDAAAAEQLPLGFGHVLVARPAQDVDRRHVPQAQRHQGQGGHAAEHEDPVGARLGDGVDRGRIIAAPFDRRRAGHHFPHAGHLGRNDAHLGRAEHRIASARVCSCPRGPRECADARASRPAGSRPPAAAGWRAGPVRTPARCSGRNRYRAAFARALREIASSICRRSSSKLSGVQSSNFRLYLRTASIPPRSSLRSISLTTCAVCGSASNSRCPPGLKICTVVSLKVSQKQAKVSFISKLLSLQGEVRVRVRVA